MRAISLAILALGSARTPHVLRVRSGFSALSESKLAAPITPTVIGSRFSQLSQLL
ncbi:L-asparaginase [Dickeya zeae]|nr:L-asparaginase [Dickeya zeae]